MGRSKWADYMYFRDINPRTYNRIEVGRQTSEKARIIDHFLIKSKFERKISLFKNRSISNQNLKKDNHNIHSCIIQE